MTDRIPRITALAGTNGAGKSSIIGEFIRARGGTWYDPDAAARTLRAAHPDLPQEEANGLAWTLGREGLEAAIVNRTDYVFETTLGGDTIPALLRDAARQGIRVTIWYIGLDGADEHIRRVRARAARGGHDIDAAKIRERYDRSRENLVSLLPDLHELKLFDNSRTVDMATGEVPRPRPLLHFRAGRILDQVDPRTMPEWARPLAMAAFKAADR